MENYIFIKNIYINLFYIGVGGGGNGFGGGGGCLNVDFGGKGGGGWCNNEGFD